MGAHRRKIELPIERKYAYFYLYFSEKSIIRKKNTKYNENGRIEKKKITLRSNLIKVFLELFYNGLTNLRLNLLKKYYMVVLKTGHIIYYEYFVFPFLLDYERIVDKSSSGD